ncbi:MAG: TrbI F-type domain-containing protein [Rhodospirillales bacterium]|nr:TrbI F-type domain-containing protein [Rhodospirillales bacterium]
MPRGVDSRRLAEGLPAVDLPAAACTLVLAAAVAAAVAVAMVRLTQPDPPRIASVRLGELTARFALDVASDASSGEAATAEARRWAAALEQALRATAERHGAVLLPARAVAAGALDLTADVELTLLRLLEEPEADAGVAPTGTRP